ncbi:MAG: hypothetical protein QOJ34_3206 [Pseudonocardiales bacterium]|jgi:hypothetical protein|nr:hypothetical protein [Pseudonocardiales bacterium]
MIAGSHPSEVNEADRMEQNTPVLGPDEDDYPHEAPR